MFVIKYNYENFSGMSESKSIQFNNIYIEI